MIYRPHNCNLGDHWQTISLCRWHGSRGNRLTLSLAEQNQQQQARIREITSLLDYRECGPVLTMEPSTTHFDGYHIWAAPSCPTMTRWQGPHCDRMACYQFDGHSSSECKNPPEDQAVSILDHLDSRGFALERLGSHRTLAECVDILSRSAIFVGCCSGMSHVAHSVGVPVYLYEHRLHVITCHRQKQFVIVHSAADFVSQVRPYLELL